ncbi:MAG: Fic family protein [Dysgonamonadaceae bacterium]|jgi:fido (protein-threonine AMPylation protein)|nr:Fic family protein [Dysgonamonadaceae bacterium]
MTNFDEYIRQGEPSRKEKAQIWQTAIGLQDVDGLKPSEYLLQTARENIEGDITIDEVKKRIDSYYKQQSSRQNAETERTEEADKVSARITEILSNNTFSFSPLEYINIHRRLFTGIYKFAGKIRDYNITKNEWVLTGKSVFYPDCSMISQTLDYDFAQEKQFDYGQLDVVQSVQHIAKFISGLWQIHAFGEGNTRTTAVFAIKYLRSFGFEINNTLFAAYSWYFRNALVRANYNDLKNNIKATTEYLMKFFGNLLLGEKNELKNRYMLVGGEFQSAISSDNDVSKSKICTLNCTLEEFFVLDFLKENPKATQKEIALHIKKSERTVKTLTTALQEKGLLERKNGKRNGFWKILNS